MAERVEAPNALMGKPDGPHLFVPELDLEVPTFDDPREDLIPPKARAFKRLRHHVPFNMRGPYKPQWLPPKFFAMYGHQYLTDSTGYVMCFGTKKDGSKCGHQAVNRTPYCANHGGALHPADKRLSSKNVSIDKIEPERIENLDRVQKFMAGFITVKDLEDDEILGAFVRNDDGRPISNTKLGERFQQDMVKELMSRMQKFMQMKLPNMLKVLADLAESDFVEPADRYKAATWLAERVLGKVPDVVFHGSTDQPYERMLALASGSRTDYRNANHVKSQRIPEDFGDVLDATVVDDESDLEPHGDFGPDAMGDGSDGDEYAPASETDSDGASEDTGVVVDAADAPTAAQLAKEARERIKKARTRRFAARAQGVVTKGEPAWLIEYKPIVSKKDGLSAKPKGFRAKLWLPEAQTQAVVDRIREADLAQIGA
ncbi:terminase small subunit [Mycobacterium phage Barnyard]|uniref:Uncharacterized protein n=1 Tax=Mycobacterium phage Barnyard TaxID=205880 RepID=Q856H0_9CAUD|nr:terminase small subunit [Mycobacterium phage Barnyard]AAN02056.1 hypothetical protein PBI_BARNYARD_2 [Mycobacterium phage Barnyard]